MSDETFARLSQLSEAQGAAATLEHLIETLREQKKYHELFDALLMKQRHELGLPLVRPTSLDDVPEDIRDRFEESYVDAAREIGGLFLAEGDVPKAWLYLRSIREPENVAAAIEALDVTQETEEEIVDIALYQRVAPVKGLEMLLASHGTCNSITVLDQQFAELEPDVRKQCAGLLVRTLYNDLMQSIAMEIERKQAFAPTAQSLRELIAGRDWLFADGNYHIDVSHLNSVVRFSRTFDPGCEELDMALQLAEYGEQLDEQYQYPGDPPFDTFYPAHVQYFKAISGDSEAVDYFKEKLDEVEENDAVYVAYNLVELLLRLDRAAEALDVAAEHLLEVQDQLDVSFPELCEKAGQLDRLQNVSQEKGDLINYTAALLQQSTQKV